MHCGIKTSPKYSFHRGADSGDIARHAERHRAAATASAPKNKGARRGNDNEEKTREKEE